MRHVGESTQTLNQGPLRDPATIPDRQPTTVNDQDGPIRGLKVRQRGPPSRSHSRILAQGVVTVEFLLRVSYIAWRVVTR
jgi:hypothetical protein